MANRIIITKDNANKLLGFNDVLLVSKTNKNEFRVGEAYFNEDSNDNTDKLVLKTFEYNLNVKKLIKHLKSLQKQIVMMHISTTIAISLIW